MKLAVNKKIINVVSVIGLVAALWYLYTKRDTLSQIADANLGDIAIATFFLILFWFFTGVRFNLVLQMYNLKLKIYEWFGLTIMTKFFGYFVPFSGGVVVKAVYLKKNYDFDYTNFIGSSIGLYLISVFLNSIMALLLFVFYGEFDNPKILAISLALLAFVIFIPVVVSLSFYLKDKIKNKWFVKISNSMQFFITKPKILFKLILNHVALRLTLAISFYFFFKAIGANPNILEASIMSIMVALSIVYSITPGNIGVTESVMISIALMFSFTFDEGLLGSLIYRGVEMIIILIWGIWFSRYLSVQLVNAKDE